MSEFVEPNYFYRAYLEKVVDGDTIDVSIDVGFQTTVFKRLRFMEIDTEELRSSDPERKARAYEAKDFVFEKLSNADKVYVQTKMDATGKYGRVLAWVWFEENNERYCLNTLLRENGYEKAP